MKPASIDLSNTTFLVGAGISIDAPSYIPAAQPLGDLLVDWICEPAPKLRPFLDGLRQPATVRQPYQGVFASLRFELMLQWLDFYVPEVMDCLSFFDLTGYPNKWHFILAEAMHAGATVLTTNFDTRIEEACSDIDVEVRDVILSDRNLHPESIRRANLVKLHGSFESTKAFTLRRKTRPVISLNQISRLGFGYNREVHVAEALRSHLNGRDLIVAGYSAWDSYDVVHLLEEASPKSVRWHVYAEDKKPVITLIQSGKPWWQVTKDDTPADLVLRKLASQKNADIQEIRSSTSLFFQKLLPIEIYEHASQLHGLTSERALEMKYSAEQSLEKVRDLLFDDECRLHVDESRAIVEKMISAYGGGWEPQREDQITDKLDAAIDDYDGLILSAELNERIKQKRTGEDEFESRSHELALKGDYVQLGKHFLERINRLHPERTPLFAEVALWAVHHAYEQAEHAEKYQQAWSLSRLFRKTAIQRRSLWGEVYASYLEAKAHFGWSLSKAVLAGKRKRSASWHRNRCYQLLESVEIFAFRIPRIDLMLEAALLRLKTAPDDSSKATQRAFLAHWLDHVQDDDLRNRIDQALQHM